MSLFVSTTITADRCVDIPASSRGGILIRAAGQCGTWKVVQSVNGSPITIATGTVSCDPATPVGVVTGNQPSSICFEGVTDTCCVMLNVEEINSAAVLSTGGGGSAGSSQSTQLLQVCAAIPAQAGEEVTENSLPIDMIVTDPLYESRLSEFIYDGITYDIDPDVVLNPIGSTFDGDYSTFSEAFRTAFESLTGQTLASFTEWGVSAGGGGAYAFTPPTVATTGFISIVGVSAFNSNYLIADIFGDIKEYDTSGALVGTLFNASAQGVPVNDVAFDGTDVWVLFNGNVKQYDATGAYSGNSFNVGGGSTPQSMAWVGSELWVLNSVGQLLRYDAALSLIATTPLPNVTAISYDGSNAWVTDSDGDFVRQLDAVGSLTGTTIDVSAELLGVTTLSGLAFNANQMLIASDANDSNTLYLYEQAGGADVLNIPTAGGTADLSLLTSVTMENFDGASVVETQAPSVGAIADNTFTTFAITAEQIPALLSVCYESCAEVSRTITTLAGGALDPAYAVIECSAGEEVPYAVTLPLPNLSEFAPDPSLVFKSITISVQAGAITTTDEFGNIASYTAGDVIEIGSGNDAVLDITGYTVASTDESTIIQVIGEVYK